MEQAVSQQRLRYLSCPIFHPSHLLQYLALNKAVGNIWVRWGNSYSQCLVQCGGVLFGRVRAMPGMHLCMHACLVSFLQPSYLQGFDSLKY